MKSCYDACSVTKCTKLQLIVTAGLCGTIMSALRGGFLQSAHVSLHSVVIIL